jgi:DNA-binding NtrC family response regulator
MTTNLRVLSIGSTKSCNFVRDALLQRHKCYLSIVTDYRELCAISSNERFDIAILHPTLSEHELRNSTEHIRRHWPRVKILLISVSSETVDDPLYDEWAKPEISQDAFLEIIERLAINEKRNEHRLFEGQTCGSERRK